MTHEQAFVVMYRFLEKCCERKYSDVINDILSWSQTLDDNRPVDSAVWSDWIECFESVGARDISPELAFSIVRKFLEKYYSMISVVDLENLLDKMQTCANGRPVDPLIWQDWTHSVQRVLKNKEDLGTIRMVLIKPEKG